MAEAAKVRLVRCPKCQNLLPELPVYTVYKCGACGTVLRAKNRKSDEDMLSVKSDEDRVSRASEISDEEKIGVFPGKSEGFSGEGIVRSDYNSDTDVKSDNGTLGHESKVVANETDENKGVDVMNQLGKSYMNQFDSSNDKRVSKNDIGINMNREESRDDVKMGEKVRGSKENFRLDQNDSSIDKRVLKDDIRMNMNREESNDDVKMGKRVVGSRYNQSGLKESFMDFDTNSGELSDDVKMVKKVAESKPQIGTVNRSRRSGFTRADWPYGERDEQRSFPRSRRTMHSDQGSSNSHPGSMKNRNNLPNDSHGNEYVDQDRAELLNKLEELQVQLARTGVTDKPKDPVPVPLDPYSTSDARFRGRPSYYEHYPDPYPPPNRHEMGMHSVYPPMPLPNHMSGYGDPFGQLQMPQNHTYYPGRYMGDDPDPFDPYPQNPNFHHPNCSCFRCYNPHRLVPPFSHGDKHRGFSPQVETHGGYAPRVENPVRYPPRLYNPVPLDPPLNSQDPRNQARWSGDHSHEMRGFGRTHPERAVLPRSGRRCRPIAGGAPFITCYSCFELVQLPKKILVVEKNQQKARCGSCSMVIAFFLVNKKLMVSPPQNKATPGHVNNGSMNSLISEDYDNYGYEYQSMDRVHASSSSHHRLNSSKSEDFKGHDSSTSSSSISKDDEDLTGTTTTPPPPLPPPPGSPLQVLFDYSTVHHRGGNQDDKGNQSGRSEQAKVIKKDPVRDASLATEMEVSFTEYSNNTGVSVESGDAMPSERLRNNFGETSRSDETDDDERVSVTINGYPIPDHLVKKAERKAGHIYPGNYWYDRQAGFWGVIGMPCFGIIPPYIEEFNYPIPEDCACGNTAVFVNGRELNEKDLDLLISRGLPDDRNRSYSINISGSVHDEDTGEKLTSLGKLAPTVEKAKRGFGMRAPRSIPSS